MFSVVFLLSGALCASIGLGADCFPTDKIRFGRTYSRAGTKFASKSKQLGEGYKLAIDMINSDGGVICGGKSYDMELLSSNELDDASIAEQTKSQTETLINSGSIDFLLAPYSSGLSGKASEVTGDKGWVIVYSGASSDSLFTSPKNEALPYNAANNDKYGKYNFGLFTRASKYQEAVVQALSDKSVSKICILCRDPNASSFPQKVALGALALAQQAGMTVIGGDVLYHTDGNAESEIQGQLKTCREQGAEAILANTNSEPDAEHYVQAARHAFGPNSPWWPKIMSITVYAAEPLFINRMGEDALHILGPTQWTVDVATRPDNAANGGGSLFGDAKAVAAEYIKRYGSTPSYQAAGAVASVLVFKLAIEAAAAANAGQMLTQAMIGDAILAFDNLPSFWADLNFRDNGLLVTKNDAEKPMFSTQVQLTTTGEIPVVLPIEYASSNLQAEEDSAKFQFEYPSLKFLSQQAGRVRALGETNTELTTCQENAKKFDDDLSKARQEAKADCNIDLAVAETKCNSEIEAARNNSPDLNLKAAKDKLELDLKAARENFEADLKKAKDDCSGSDDSSSSTLMIVFIVLTAILALALTGVLCMERAGEPCCGSKKRFTLGDKTLADP